ncbi:MAG: adenosine monophosphate-protein transferase [Candidatus Altiarchaeota archaeon]|nr:adenosine monophosphate-protein transferase [Candidatus Altiarchaeota archaeon]
MVEIITVDIEKPEEVNLILGTSHFIKTVDDVFGALADSAPGIKFGLAFCEASGPRLIRKAGNEPSLVELAVKNAQKIGAGHSFIIFMKNGYPINVLPRLRQISELVTLWAATANPLQVIIAETKNGRGIMGVIDGGSPLGVEDKKEAKARKDFLVKVGYKPHS